MKKFLILISIILLATGCSAKTIAWDEAIGKYESLYSETVEEAATYRSYSAEEFKALVAKIMEATASLHTGMKEEDEENALSLYKDAILLEQLSSQSNSLQSNTLSQFGEKIETLIRAAYEKASDFDLLKKQITDLGAQIDTWTQDDWSLVVKRNRISWAAVEQDYQTLEETTIDGLTPNDEVSEAELEEYKNTILNNYKLIANGVDEENRKNADVIYEAGVALREYTQYLNSDTADKVCRFALQACDYVKAAYGVPADDPDFNFPAQAAEAQKWTLSIWNELVKLLNM